MLICKSSHNEVRWQQGERLDHLFEQRCDLSNGMDPAVIAADRVYSYGDLDRRANKVARYLRSLGLGAGDRIGLLFDKSFETYVALLAVLKLNAAYVPFDAGFPDQRIQFILQDAEVKAILSLSSFAEKLGALATPSILLDSAEPAIDEQDASRLVDAEKRFCDDQLAYIIYTSGTTGNPKGVAVEHPSICNFVKVAAEVYGYRSGDRVFQGMTIAFDFSCEELWVPLVAGATLVPSKAGVSLVGEDLAAFLAEQRVTALCCVPTLLATIERELPDLRLLLVSGEACPHHLVVRWHRPGRTILNAYGPTEATVTATLTELEPNKAVTIGGPLPTYTIVILDEHEGKLVAPGALGEIGIAGIGLAKGYLNRDDLTAAKFIPDFLDIANNPSRRIYRTGDLGRINDDGEVEFHGRIDTQVKVRGYRIELTEIESVLMQLPQIAQAVVSTHEAEPGAVELVAYYTLKQDAAEIPASDIAAIMRKHLPRYMIPAYVEKLAVIPMSVSNKADRKLLPAPKGPRFAAESTTFVAPRSKMETMLAGALADVLKVERISVEDNFFTDLGAHSLLMARFCSAIRQDAALAGVSMKDIYLNPTIEKLARHLATRPVELPVQVRQEPLRIPSKIEYYGCGTLQALTYAATALLTLALLAWAFEWTYAAIDNMALLYGRIVAVTAGSFVLFNAMPIAAKWLLIGRWKEEVIPIWSLRYYRFWLVKSLIRSAPLALFVGTPLYNVYLRMLGAKIGRNVVINARFLPVCTDLLSIGDNTLLRKDTVLLGYKAQSNYIYTGAITIGANASVGEASVLDIDTVMGDDTQLGHTSSLQSGQRVPAGRHYHGSPAVETTANYNTVEPMVCSNLRRGAYSAMQLVSLIGLFAPLPILALYYVFPHLLSQTNGMSMLQEGANSFGLLTLEVLVISLALFFGSIVTGLASIYFVPRFFNLFLQEAKTYVLYGFHFYAQRIVSAYSNSHTYNMLFGDSSFIIGFLKLVGYKLNKVEQTGSNFGTSQKHENPFLCDIGSGTMVSDGLSMMNVQMSTTSFRVSKVKIGDQNYLGNNIHYPPEGRTGANCLFGTKTMVPVDGPVRENVGLLGSPCFEIPRVNERDQNFEAAMSDELKRERLAGKNKHNIVTIALYLGCYWTVFFVTLLSGAVAVLNYPAYGLASLIAGGVFASVFAFAFLVIMERAAIGFGQLEPKIASTYDPYFWYHERHWKLCDATLTALFKGTPFKNWISRLTGVKVGKMVFDDGCEFVEKSLISIGDYTNLNEAALLQGHTLEEGVFKSDHIAIGRGCSIGSAVLVNYGVKMGDNSVLGPDSFLMKGEVVEANATWCGNPARAVRTKAVSVPATSGVAPEALAAAA